MTSPDDLVPQSDSRDPLDAWLGDATWPEPDRHSLDRLRRHWRRVSPRRARQQRWMMIVAAAAACLLVALMARPWHAPPVSDPSTSPKQAVRDVPPSGRSVAQPSEGGPQPVHAPKTVAGGCSREPTLLEQLAFRMVANRRQASTLRQYEQLLDAAIAQLAADPQTDLNTLCQPLHERSALIEEQLLRRIPHLDGQKQVAAICLLGRLGGPRSIPLLSEACCYESTHAAAVLALARRADPADIRRLALAETDPELKQELVAVLLARQDEQSLGIYLEFVRSRQTRQAALGVLHRVEDPPVELLFGFLRSRRHSQRLAAARVLGCLDGPVISQRLIAMVLGNVNRQEAMVALLASSRLEAAEFVEHARSDYSLTAAVHAAQYQLRSAFQ